MDSFKGLLSAKIGDEVNIMGNGMKKIQPGFQIIFTSNIKSEKHPEKNVIPGQMDREVSMNNIEIKYSDVDESYDIMISRLMNKDGSLDMSFYDLNHTLPELAKVMSEIQESYSNGTNPDLAKKVGGMDASGKFHSLKKFVLEHGAVETIISAWKIEQKTKIKNLCFAEFLDSYLKKALTYTSFPPEDRILAAKIFASHGFLTTLSAKDLNFPDDIFKFNTIKELRGEKAIKELREKSGDVKHLTLKDVAELDPFNKKGELLKEKAEMLLKGSLELGKDEFLEESNKRFSGVFGREKGSHLLDISSSYTFPDTGKIEQININIEQKLQEFISFYEKHKVEMPEDFEERILEIWENNIDDIEKEIKEHGFNEILLIPPTSDLPDLAEKMKESKYYYLGDNFTKGGGFEKAKSQNQDRIRLVLTHYVQNLKDHPELKKTLNTKGQDVPTLQTLSLEEYLIFSQKYFKETDKHLDEIGSTWLATATESGSRLVRSNWNGDWRNVDASGLSGQGVRRGFRSSRSYSS
jgi:hypothetical protein